MKKGFSLIEIMVVIVILGVLAAVGVPKLLGQVETIKSGVGSAYVEVGGKSSYSSDSKTMAFFKSSLLKKKQLDLMVLIVEDGSHFNKDALVQSVLTPKSGTV